MKKFFAGSAAAVGLAGGSIALAALTPLGTAFAQDTSSTASSSTTTATSAAPAPGKGGLDTVLKSLVDDGTLTQAQADAVKAKLDAARPQGEQGRRGFGADLADIASFLGTDEATLRSQLDSGSTLAQIAGDKTTALIQHLVDAANTRIDQAVTDGKMTADQAATLKADTQQRITDMVNNGMPARGEGRGPGGPGGPRGGAPGAAPSGSTSESTTTN